MGKRGECADGHGGKVRHGQPSIIFVLFGKFILHDGSIKSIYCYFMEFIVANR
jgi:hypothetical protein